MFMRLFPHSLIGKEKEWHLDQPTQTMTNWKVLEEKILDRFFPHNKFMETKTTIVIFSQGLSESLCEAWEHYKSMLRRCLNHDFDDLTQIHIICNGLQPLLKLLWDENA